MEKLEQKTIEFFFQEFKVKDPELKAKLLPEVTDIIYDYNNLIVQREKEADEYRQQQMLSEIQELEQKIKETFNSILNQK